MDHDPNAGRKKAAAIAAMAMALHMGPEPRMAASAGEVSRGRKRACSGTKGFAEKGLAKRRKKAARLARRRNR